MYTKEELTSFLIVLDQCLRNVLSFKAEDITRVIISLSDCYSKPAEEKKPNFEELLEFPNKNELDKLISYICHAKKIIRICVYWFSNKVIFKVLLDLLAKGVSVRIITDKDSKNVFTKEFDSLSEADKTNFEKNLSHMLLPIEKNQKMHHKFVIIDDFLVMTGSFNWTFLAEKRNLEHVVVLNSEVLIKQFTELFDRYWTLGVAAYT